MSSESDKHFSVPAALLALLWPGLGHIYRGRQEQPRGDGVKRGWLIMTGVLLLVITGLLVGGVDCVNSRDARLWFYPQALCGPVVWGANVINLAVIKKAPAEDQLHTRGLGRVNEMGTLFVALAGLMNLVVILDALQPAPRRTPDRRHEPHETTTIHKAPIAVNPIP